MLRGGKSTKQMCSEQPRRLWLQLAGGCAHFLGFRDNHARGDTYFLLRLVGRKVLIYSGFPESLNKYLRVTE